MALRHAFSIRTAQPTLRPGKGRSGEVGPKKPPWRRNGPSGAGITSATHEAPTPRCARRGRYWDRTSDLCRVKVPGGLIALVQNRASGPFSLALQGFSRLNISRCLSTFPGVMWTRCGRGSVPHRQNDDRRSDGHGRHPELSAAREIVRLLTPSWSVVVTKDYGDRRRLPRRILRFAARRSAASEGPQGVSIHPVATDHYRLRCLLHAGGVTWPNRPTPPRIRTRRSLL